MYEICRSNVRVLPCKLTDNIRRRQHPQVVMGVEVEAVERDIGSALYVLHGSAALQHADPGDAPSSARADGTSDGTSAEKHRDEGEEESESSLSDERCDSPTDSYVSMDAFQVINSVMNSGCFSSH